ncbi:hypothetical protein F3Y22_tig00116954pilonHSYRG00118 [Hibiscus syriacus]|uniref:Uncharacterized protein n=1 Tax=Hibiscus syriacus TaxID=106335 RepID=A0A6A2WKT2_HIBSY|nr:hypothetical protein F3Y22_tig00116954pilonHSYRG00118 [Hibiscus syriacus]
MPVKQSTGIVKRGAIEGIVAEVKPLKAVKEKEAAVCKGRNVKATVAETDADYVTGPIITFHSLP